MGCSGAGGGGCYGGGGGGCYAGGGRGGNCCDAGMGCGCAGGGGCYGGGSACGSCSGCSGCGCGYAGGGGGGGGGGGSWQGDWQGAREPESYHEGFHESFHDDRAPPGHMQPAPDPQQQWSPSAQAAGDSGGPRASSEHEELYNQWKQAIVAFAKPVLRGPFERSEITKDEFKQILKKTADKVIGSYRKEGVPPPANFEIVGSQRAKIQKLVEDYVSFIQKEKREHS